MKHTALNFYQILGVSRNASADEIKNAYRKRVLQVHADRNPQKGKAADADFIQVQEDYETLRDENKKRAYDATLNPEPQNVNQQYYKTQQVTFDSLFRNMPGRTVTEKREYFRQAVYKNTSSDSGWRVAGELLLLFDEVFGQK